MRAHIALAVLAIVACAAPARTVDNRVDPDPEARANELAMRADAVWRAEARNDYRAPMRPLDHEAATLEIEACRAGNERACWIAMTLDRSQWAVTSELVRANCRRGHQLSCRALPDFVTEPLELESSRSDGDVQQLVDGCTQGLYVECSTIHRHHDIPEMRPYRLFAARQMCLFSSNGCLRLAMMYEEARLPLQWRDAYELKCQRSGKCDMLADLYRWGRFPEPYPGRVAELIEWTCKHDKWYATLTLCGGTEPPLPP